jgi:hypothetical protein
MAPQRYGYRTAFLPSSLGEYPPAAGGGLRSLKSGLLLYALQRGPIAKIPPKNVAYLVEI